MKSSDETLVAACRILAEDIQTDDGVANAALHEIADRLEELSRSNWIKIDKNTRIKSSEVLFWFEGAPGYYGGIEHAIYFDGWNFKTEELQSLYDSGKIKITHYCDFTPPSP